jgi:hypothetical protein
MLPSEFASLEEPMKDFDVAAVTVFPTDGPE